MHHILQKQRPTRLAAGIEAQHASIQLISTDLIIWTEIIFTYIMTNVMFTSYRNVYTFAVWFYILKCFVKRLVYADDIAKEPHTIPTRAMCRMLSRCGAGDDIRSSIDGKVQQ